MEKRPCTKCGKIVERYPSRMPDGDVYCSRTCLKGKNKQEKPCAKCGDIVKRYPSQMPDGDVYCSNSCAKKGWTPVNKTENYVKCQICNKDIRERPSEKRVVCSRECYAKYSSECMSGRNNHNWKEQTHFHTDYLGYERAVSTKNESIKIHRLASVAWFGFDNTVNKHIHHKNNIPWDNREENLIPMKPSEHISLHRSENSVLSK